MRYKRGWTGREIGEGMLPPSSLGKEIRRIRLEYPGRHKLSQVNFGKKIGLTGSMISCIERGLVPLLDKYIPKLVKKYKLPKYTETKLKRLAKLQRACNPVKMPYTELQSRLKLGKAIKNHMDKMTLKEARAITKIILEHKEKPKTTKKRVIIKAKVKKPVKPKPKAKNKKTIKPKGVK